jgi:hypothetical protein
MLTLHLTARALLYITFYVRASLLLLDTFYRLMHGIEFG